MKKVKIGIDYSMNSTAISILKDSIIEFVVYINYENKFTRSLKTDSRVTVNTLIKHDGSEFGKAKYFYQVGKLITDMIMKYDSPDVYIEGFSYGGKGSSSIDLAGGQYILRSMLAINNIKFTVVPPKSIKKKAGNGNYNKDKMIERFLEDSKLMFNDLKTIKGNYYKPIDDIADSYWIIK